MRHQYNVTVLECATPWGGRHLSVERVDGKSGIPWDELQRIKNERLGPEACCIEFYPPSSELVDEINRRHLWEAPETLVPPLSRRRA